jgi:hypothetical protein
MNYKPVNPYDIIKALEEENKALRAELEKLKEEQNNGGSVDRIDNR